MVVVKPSNEPLLVMHGTEAIVAWKEGIPLVERNSTPEMSHWTDCQEEWLQLSEMSVQALQKLMP
jgi:hypothetical protein